MTYNMLLQILNEAEMRVADSELDDYVRKNSQETVDLVLELLAIDGLTREMLEEMAK